MLIFRSFLLLIFFPFWIYGAVEYSVAFKGEQNPEIISSLKEASSLLALQKYQPKTLGALRLRAESDIANLVKILHSHALYNAKVDFRMNMETDPVEIEFTIQSGPVYPIHSIEIEPKEFSIPYDILGLEQNTAATPKKILEAEEKLIQWMSKQGYPYAHLTEKEVTADQHSKSVSIYFQLNPGPLSVFGKAAITGNCRVLDRFIKQKILWKEGDIFDPEKIRCTVDALNCSGLFSLVQITYPENPPNDGKLPILIEVDEAKHRSVALGLSYSTQRGPGFTVEWENRNFRGMGERLFFDANILQLVQQTTLQYTIPQFLRANQDFVWTLEAEHDKTEGFEESWVSLSGRIEKQLSPCSNLSYGLQYKQLWVSDSDNDGSYGLFKSPIHWRYSTANDCLDPTKGYTLYGKLTPTLQVSKTPFYYTVGHLTASTYQPLKGTPLVLAGRMQFGTIFGSKRKEIAPSERLYAGSETTLRGYQYFTVSPLDKDNNPIGGRSMLVCSLEGRWRINEKWGAALFYDIGNVYNDPIPKFERKMLQSVGIGARYYTPVGPIRMDLAFPLNRRKNIDNRFQLYFSIGQSF
jgi:translocation and assembly module TamA